MNDLDGSRDSANRIPRCTTEHLDIEICEKYNALIAKGKKPYDSYRLLSREYGISINVVRMRISKKTKGV